MPSSPAWFCQRRRPLPATPPATSALAFHRDLQGYEVTPLVPVPELAETARVGEVLVKDESSRLGLPSFKVLGASWASARAVTQHLGLAEVPPLAQLREAASGSLSLTAATDGNHGRAVARMARLLGLACTIFVPGGTTDHRIAAIRDEGAAVVVIDGTYDDAVRASAAAADDSTLVVSDTSWPGYEQVPAWVIEGYRTILDEVAEQLPRGAAMDLLVVPVGVGALAAAMIRAARDLWPTVRILGVEPRSAACVQRSLRTGRISDAPGPHTSVMVGLNCDTPSLVAWPTVDAGLDAVVALDDDAVGPAVRALHGAGVRAGETGAAALAGLLALADDDAARAHLAVDAGSRVLLLVTEGVTDADTTAALLGGEVPA